MLDPTIFGENISFDSLDPPSLFIGLLNEFNNRFQTTVDSVLQDISWKQSFLLRCITFFKTPPTINQLAELTGSSHQNTKQILNKLEKSGYIQITPDKTDRRKQRVHLTEKALQLRQTHYQKTNEHMSRLFQNITAQELTSAIETITKLHINLKQITEEQK